MVLSRTTFKGFVVCLDVEKSLCLAPWFVIPTNPNKSVLIHQSTRFLFNKETNL